MTEMNVWRKATCGTFQLETYTVPGRLNLCRWRIRLQSCGLVSIILKLWGVAEIWHQLRVYVLCCSSGRIFPKISKLKNLKILRLLADSEFAAATCRAATCRPTQISAASCRLSIVLNRAILGSIRLQSLVLRQYKTISGPILLLERSIASIRTMST